MTPNERGPAPEEAGNRARKRESPHPQHTEKAGGNQVTAEQIATALNGKKSGSGWMACCPAHDDRTPSLKIDQGNDKPLVHCLAGCNQESVIDALKGRGLWPDPPPFEITHYQRGTPDHVWPYHDEAGQVIGYACRFDKADGKDVLPFFKHPDGWHWKAPTEPRPLFNQNKLTRHPDKPVAIAEGEKAAKAAERLFPGHIVTTWQGGSGAAAKADWQRLKGRVVVIWPDADLPGKKAAVPDLANQPAI